MLIDKPLNANKFVNLEKINQTILVKSIWIVMSNDKITSQHYLISTGLATNHILLP